MDYKNSQREIIKTLSDSWLHGGTLRKVTRSLMSEIQEDIANILRIIEIYGDDSIHHSYLDENISIAVNLIQDQVRCFCIGHIEEDQLIQQVTGQAKLLKNAIEGNIHSFIDPLTWLYNRAFLEKINIARNDFSVIVVDLDTLSCINNTFGHTVWDLYIKVFSEMLRKSVRVKKIDTEPWIREISSRLDYPIRMWGDEFVLLLDTADKSVLEEIILPRIDSGLFVENFIQRFEEYRGKSLTQEELTLIQSNAGCSIGTALPNGVSSIKDLIDQADESMYNNKSSQWTIQRLVNLYENLPLASQAKFLKALEARFLQAK